MLRIWKFPLNGDTLVIPKDFKPLSLQLQNGVPTLWALVDELSGEETYQLNKYSTGCYIPEDQRPEVYLGTLQLPSKSDYVSHYFFEQKGTWHQ